MIDLKTLTDDEIVALIKDGKVRNKELTDAGICPTCFNKTHNDVLYGNNEDKILYEDEILECSLVGNPRCPGHAMIGTKKHFKDMMEVDEETLTEVMLLSQDVMKIIKKVYESESVYLCTMCDGPMNHFHVQLIPRYSYEERGSDNFNKKRQEYIHEPEKIEKVRKLILRRISMR